MQHNDSVIHLALANTWGIFTESAAKNAVVTFKPQLQVPKISNPEFSAWVNLCYKMADSFSGSLEVQTILLLNKQLGKWKFLIPTQKVTGGSVKDANLKDCIDLITGERYLNHDYPKGYRHVGSSHSHGHLSAFFSGVDDASELGFPGLHCTFGALSSNSTTFQIAASVVHKNIRYCFDANEVFDIEYDDRVNYHCNVDKQIVETKFDASIRYINYFDSTNVEPPFVKYTSKYSQMLQNVNKQHSLLDKLVDDLSDELFLTLAEAENVDFISREEAEEYMLSYDAKLTAVLKEDIPAPEKISQMETFCNRIVQRIKSGINN